MMESEARLWAETKGFLYYETSAQTGQNVVEMFQVCKINAHIHTWPNMEHLHVNVYTVDVHVIIFYIYNQLRHNYVILHGCNHSIYALATKAPSCNLYEKELA